MSEALEAARGTSALVMPEQRTNQNDRQRNAKKPQKRASTKSHDVLLGVSNVPDWNDPGSGQVIAEKWRYRWRSTSRKATTPARAR